MGDIAGHPNSSHKVMPEPCPVPPTAAAEVDAPGSRQPPHATTIHHVKAAAGTAADLQGLIIKLPDDMPYNMLKDALKFIRQELDECSNFGGNGKQPYDHCHDMR